MSLRRKLGPQWVNSNTWTSFSKWIRPNSCSSTYGSHFKQVSFTTKQDHVWAFTPRLQSVAAVRFGC